MADPVQQYPLDLTGVSSTNLIQSEPHTLDPGINRALVPNYGAFYTQSNFIITDTADGSVLTAGVQYYPVMYWDVPSERSGLEVCAGIVIVDTNVSANVEITYQAVGGDYLNIASLLIAEIENLNLDERTITWGDLLGLPDFFPSASHLHALGDIYGFENVVNELNKLQQAILNGNTAEQNEIRQIIVSVKNALAQSTTTLRDEYEAFVTNMQKVNGNLTSPLLFMPLKNTLSLVRGIGAITFDRTSIASYIDRYGDLRSVAVDEPRFGSRGALLEGSSTNLLTYSEEFDNAAWVASNATATADVATAPDGTTTADKMVENSLESLHYLVRSLTVTAGAIATYSVHTKAAERDEILLRIDDGSTNNGFVVFDLATGEVGSSSIAGLATDIDASIEVLSDGWYRCSITCKPSTTSTTYRVIAYLVNGGAMNYLGDGTSGIYIWGAQFEEFTGATSYIPTTSTAVTRLADSVSIPVYGNVSKDIYSFAVDVDIPDILGNAPTDTRYILWFPTTDPSVAMASLYVGTDNKVHAQFGDLDIATTLTQVNESHRYLVTYDPDTNGVSLYVDGVLEVSGTVTTPNVLDTTGNILLGDTPNGNGPLFGYETNFRTWDFTLTAAEARMA